MKINFHNVTINAFSENMPLINTISGHYAIPFTHSTQFINDIHRESPITVTLMITDKNNDTQISLPIRTPTSDKFINLVKNA